MFLFFQHISDSLPLLWVFSISFSPVICSVFHTLCIHQVLAIVLALLHTCNTTTVGYLDNFLLMEQLTEVLTDNVALTIKNLEKV